MPPRSKRNRKTIDYSQFGTAENHSDDDEDVTIDNLIDDFQNDQDVEDDEDDDENLVQHKNTTQNNIELIESENEQGSTKNKRKKQNGKHKDNKPKKNKIKLESKEIETPKIDIRQMKQVTNYKEKLTRIFGFNNEKLADVIQLRQLWEDSLFKVNLDIIQDEFEDSQDLDYPESLYQIISEFNFFSEFSFVDQESQKRIIFDNNEVQSDVLLPIAGSIRSDTAIFLNTGFQITDLTWLRLESNDNESYLLVGVSDLTDKFSQIPSTFSERRTYPSGFQLYKLNKPANELVLIKSILHKFGNSWNLKVSPLSDAKSLAVVSANFNDGSVKLFTIPNNDDKYLELREPTIEVSLHNDIISTYDFLGKNKIVVGTNSGNIAIFDISESADTPIDIYPVSSHHIFSICVGESKYDESIVYASFANGSTVCFEPHNILGTINRLPKSRAISTRIAYSPQLYSFIQLEGIYTSKCFPSRALFFNLPLTKHDGSTESLALSKLHPLILTGGADGKVKISSLARRLLAGPKQPLNGHKIATLWEVQYNAKLDTFKVIQTLEPEKLKTHDNVNSANIYSKEVAIMALGWNENKNFANLYAAGSKSGLVIIDTA
ncbi:hypothetical protein WICMUC_004373 [Wickerhamomyces mucosus]|uniref:Uncharacterized protein n=1 Tax=Wickerhamomyces mucosus TaxID=1378264 RepID=A0A9P8PHD3_9ASCO|nr:hypothetical protein WICMUC_004373 [Wickerhamomyces mucosus]